MTALNEGRNISPPLHLCHLFVCLEFHGVLTGKCVTLVLHSDPYRGCESYVPVHLGMGPAPLLGFWAPPNHHSSFFWETKDSTVRCTHSHLLGLCFHRVCSKALTWNQQQPFLVVLRHWVTVGWAEPWMGHWWLKVKEASQEHWISTWSTNKRYSIAANCLPS